MSIPLLTRRPGQGLGNVRRSYADPSRNIDWILMIAVALQTVIGVFMVYSATRPRLINSGQDEFMVVQRQIVFILFAIIAMVSVMAVDYGRLRGNAEFFYVVTQVLLVLVLVSGAVSGGARLSFDLGIISVQPSELAKFTVLLLLAGFLADDATEVVSYERFIQSLLIVGLPVLLVLVEPDLGSATVLVAAAMGVLLVAGARIKYIVLVTSLAVVSMAAAVVGGVVKDYQVRRVIAFLNQNAETASLQNVLRQVRFAKRAVATGGITGKGYLNGPLTNGQFIPVQSTDFVFSAVGEQFGLIGCGIVITLLAVILWRIFRVARMAKDRLGLYLCAGIFTMVLWQSFQNIGMTLGITPVSGVPLPFVSYGGSHTVAFAAMVGLVQNVHMRRFR
ncbi:MAG: rod shape-determining protein RodA [Actinomycetota bacterium]|jgi:rod shape determining protein RodA